MLINSSPFGAAIVLVEDRFVAGLGSTGSLTGTSCSAAQLPFADRRCRSGVGRKSPFGSEQYKHRLNDGFGSVEPGSAKRGHLVTA